MRGSLIKFGEFELDFDRYQLRRAGKGLKLEKMPMELLILLATRNGHLVTRSEIVERLWGKDVFVDTERGINTVIRKIRQVLNDNPELPRFVETVTGKGYRFIAPVTGVDELAVSKNDPAEVANANGSMLFLPPTPPPWVEADLAKQRLATEPNQMRNGRGPTWAISLGALAVFSLLVMLQVFAVKATRSPRLAQLDSAQLTFSAEPKEGPLFTDGARIYLNSRGVPSEMAASGGPVVPLHVLGPGIFLQDILPDGSQALGWKPKPDDELGRGTLWTASMLGGEPRKLTDHLAEHARWSPEGRAIVFSDRSALYKIDKDGRNLRKIWDAPGDLRAFSCSPDGRQLSATVGVSATVGADSAPTRLWSVGADGQNAHPLRLDWPANASQHSGRWTADGRHFVFSSDREERTNLYELAAPPWFAFWRKPTAVRVTGNQLPILAAAPMRDSQGLFVLGKTDEGAMRAYDSRSKKLLPYLDDLSMIGFVISPDRRWMAYSEYPSRHLWKSRLDGSERVQLTSSVALMQQWSPDGKWLAYTDFHNVYLVSAAGGAPQKLTPDGADGVAPSWFPDGKSIAFNNYPYPDKPFRVRVIDLATRRISDMPGADRYYVPSWSPDGKYMVAMAQNPSRMVLYSAQTKTWKDLRTFDVPWGFWTWASDSKSIYMGLVLGNNGIYQLTVPRGEWKQLCGLDGVNDPRGADSFMSLTPDGQPAIMSRTGIGQIYSLRWPD